MILNNPWIVIIIIVIIIIFLIIYRGCQNPIPNNPIIIKSNEGQNFYYDGERPITIKYQSEDISLFTIRIVPHQIAQKHVDKNYDQFFIIIEGTFTITYTDVNNGKQITVILNPQDFIFLKRGTLFQFKNISDTSGYMIGGFLPGDRVQLIRDLAAYEKKVGPDNLNINDILKMETSYCVFKE